MRKYLLGVSSVLVLGILMGCGSKPKFTGCVGPNNCRPQEMNSTAGMTSNSAFSVSKIDIQANDMAWDPRSQQIDLSVATSNGTNGNTITVLNPFTGQFAASQNAGNGSDQFAMTSDGSRAEGVSFHGLMVRDGTLNLAYSLGQGDSEQGTENYTLEAFDLTHYTLLGAVSIPNVIGTPVKLIRWGTNGLAFLKQTRDASTGSIRPGPGNGVYLIRGSFITNPAAQAGVASPRR